VTSGPSKLEVNEWREKDKKRLNTEETEEEAEITQRRVEESPPSP
jgi:hypothetical protein